MSPKIKPFLLFLPLLVLSLPASAVVKKSAKTRKAEVETTGPAVLWRNPTDIASRDLFYGPGGEPHQPSGSFTFIEEDLEGSNPKFVVRDQDGVKWKVKLGLEARPETVASRLVWAVGFFANEDYFVPHFRVANMPLHLHRGQKLVAPDGSMQDVRLKRYLKGEKKLSDWDWNNDPFTNTRELNGLRVMMALINNWDLKGENNHVYQEEGAHGPEQIYMVSDLGASFGTPRLTWPLKRSRGNLGTYRHSKFITKIAPLYVDFQAPALAAPYFWFTPREYLLRLHEHWIGRHIPRDDARWMGQVLARLSPSQIRDAFFAASYTPQEVDAFARIVEDRIADLDKL
jgi:hypothetical protein